MAALLQRKSARFLRRCLQARRSAWMVCGWKTKPLRGENRSGEMHLDNKDRRAEVGGQLSAKPRVLLGKAQGAGAGYHGLAEICSMGASPNSSYIGHG